MSIAEPVCQLLDQVNAEIHFMVDAPGALDIEEMERVRRLRDALNLFIRGS